MGFSLGRRGVFLFEIFFLRGGCWGLIVLFNMEFLLMRLGSLLCKNTKGGLVDLQRAPSFRTSILA